MKVAQRAEVTIPLGDKSVPARFLSFEGLSDGKEHIAIVFGDGEEQAAPLVRLHSECLTGDVFGSQRCDCGKQLEEAQKRMAQHGGILLYLRQEGRGIGLYNKLDAYQLQDEGVDTYAANEMLGFDHDLRDFSQAVEMLNAIGVKQVRLLTNNPQKANQLTEKGIDVIECVPTGVFVNTHNASYLKAKVDQHNHKIDLLKNKSES